MLLFIAGHTNTGAVVANNWVDNISSAIPYAILAIILAVAGAIT